MTKTVQSYHKLFLKINRQKFVTSTSPSNNFSTYADIRPMFAIKKKQKLAEFRKLKMQEKRSTKSATAADINRNEKCH